MKRGRWTDGENRLYEAIERAAGEARFPLEMEGLDDGWYAYMYTGSEAIPVNDYYRKMPLITYRQCIEYNIDVDRVFAKADVYVCG